MRSSNPQAPIYTGLPLAVRASTKPSASEFKQAEDLLTSGERAEARRQLRTIDARYGELAAPRNTELAVK
jgi:hypothetical protein